MLCRISIQLLVSDASHNIPNTHSNSNPHKLTSNTLVFCRFFEYVKTTLHLIDITSSNIHSCQSCLCFF